MDHIPWSGLLVRRPDDRAESRAQVHCVGCFVHNSRGFHLRNLRMRVVCENGIPRSCAVRNLNNWARQLRPVLTIVKLSLFPPPEGLLPPPVRSFYKQ